MKSPTLFGVLIALGACATEPVYTVPAEQAVADYVQIAQLDQVDHIRKGAHDSWRYVNDRYVIYRARTDDFLVEFRRNCGVLTDNSWLPADYIHDHRNMRAGEDTIRGCIVDRIYPITDIQRIELRHLPPGQPN